jgi:hypothetical protein
MADVSTLSEEQDFTSGRGDGTFEICVEDEDIPDYNKLYIEADIVDCDYQNMNNTIHVTLVNTLKKTPTIYDVPDVDTEYLQLPLDVHRGPKHPKDEFIELNLEVTVSATVEGSGTKKLGSDRVRLNG